MIVIEGNCSSRCGISLKGADIVVGGGVGHVSGFMAQAGRMVICGDAAAGLGDSIYEAVIYVRGKIASLGADAREEPMSDADRAAVTTLLTRAGINLSPGDFKRIASARSLYHWNVDANQEY
jgi:glutamate synthase domain-containing protein 3